MLNISDVYATIHKQLRTDPTIRELMGFEEGLDSQEDLLQSATKIVKRKIPNDLLKEQSFPLIAFYKLPGGREFDNYLSYLSPFDFDIYTNNDVGTAIKIADRINK